MNTSDWFIIASVLSTILVVLLSYTNKGSYQGNKRNVASNILIHIIFLGLIAGSILEKGNLLHRCFWFGFIAGGVMQPLLADPYLTKRTLKYNMGGPKIRSTPTWMACLWTIVLCQLLYFATRMNARPLWFTPIVVISSIAYFYICELITGNKTHWWQRSNCHQRLNVANYVTIAEINTSLFVVAFSIYASQIGLIYFGTITILLGFVFVLFFVTLCRKAYQK